MRQRIIWIIKWLLACFAVFVVLIGAFLFIGWPRVDAHVTYGVTFSRPYAESLDLDPDHVLQIALDRIGIRRFRIPAYWKLVEPKEGTWNFTELDKDIDAIHQRGGSVILSIGEKQPRWPECWQPEWWKRLPQNQQRQKTLQYIETMVRHYRANPTIVSWQVENEPHFSYGDCLPTDISFLHQETTLVRALDPTRPISTTDSGELSLWTGLSKDIDRLGVSVYRVVRNPAIGNLNFHYWFVRPHFYQRKANLLRFFGVGDIYVSEFQMEPWSNTELIRTPIADQLTSINATQMESNFSFAERMGIDTIDFWGLEWWVWMADKQGHPEFLQLATQFYQEHR